MKRIGFKPQFVEGILNGTKRATMRAKSLNVKEGDIVACMTSCDGKPWFLRPASEAFAHVEIMFVYRACGPRILDFGVMNYDFFGFNSEDEARKFYDKAMNGNAAYIYTFKLVPAPATEEGK